MKNDFTKINLFSCPIYKIRIDPNLYDKEKIINDIKYNKSLKNIRTPQEHFNNSNIHQSFDDQDNEDFRIINYEKLEVIYLEKINEFFNEEIYTKKAFGFNFRILNYSAVTEGQWMQVHNHLLCDHFACIHYLNFKNDHGVTCFHNPANFAPFVKFIQPELGDVLDSTAPDNSYMYEHFSFLVKEDDFVIFPAALNHEIKVQGPTKEPRITIAGNVRIFPLTQENLKEVA